MQHGISTHLFLPQRLTPGLLDTLARGGATAVEVFASRHHFDYTDRGAVRELANWFGSNNAAATMHMPLFSEDEEAQWSKHTEPGLNLITPNKSARIAAMDEVKRALEAAEQVPFRSCVMHLGQKDDRWDTRALDDSLTAIEHLKAFAGPLGVKLLLENIPNAVATPEHLAEIVRVGHFDNVGFCLDIGHAHLDAPVPETRDSAAKSGVAQAFAAFGEGVAELHLHDNGGLRDEHCWPGEGKVDWAEVFALAAALKQAPVGVLEIAHEQGYDQAAAAKKARKAWDVVLGARQ